MGAAAASLALLAGATGATTASAATTSPTFTCNATILRILGIDPSSLLGLTDSCTSAHGGIDLPLAAGNRIFVLHGLTNNVGGIGSSESAVLDLAVVSSNALPVSLLRSSAYVTCRAGKPSVSGGSSTIAGGTSFVTAPVSVSQPLSIGSVIFVNETVADETGITQRALRVATPLGDVVLAEARAGVRGNPCRKAHRRRG